MSVRAHIVWSVLHKPSITEMLEKQGFMYVWMVPSVAEE